MKFTKKMNGQAENVFHLPQAPRPPELLGLSLREFERCMNTPFSANNEFFELDLSDTSALAQTPLIQQATGLLGRLSRSDGLALTPKKNLKQAVVRELYNEFYKNEFFPSTPNSEDDVPDLTRIRSLLEIDGYVRTQKNRLVLTAKGKKCVSDVSDTKKYPLMISNLYKGLTNRLFNQWNWYFGTRLLAGSLMDEQIIEASRIFCIYILHKQGSKWRNKNALAQTFRNAFVEGEIKDPLDAIFDPFIGGYSFLFLGKIAKFLGWVESRNDEELFSQNQEFRSTKLFKASVKWKLSPQN